MVGRGVGAGLQTGRLTGEQTGPRCLQEQHKPARSPEGLQQGGAPPGLPATQPGPPTGCGRGGGAAAGVPADNQTCWQVWKWWWRETQGDLGARRWTAGGQRRVWRNHKLLWMVRCAYVRVRRHGEKTQGRRGLARSWLEEAAGCVGDGVRRGRRGAGGCGWASPAQGTFNWARTVGACPASVGVSGDGTQSPAAGPGTSLAQGLAWPAVQA